MTETIKPKRRQTAQHSAPLAPPPSTSAQARRQAAAILEVLAGIHRPTEAAQVLGTSLPRYYQLERRALLGLLAACEPAARGPRLDLSRQLTALQRENHRLRRECERRQALVRMAERSLGLTMPVAKPPAKGKEESPNGNGTKRRRSRRPTVRALKMAKSLQVTAPAEVPAETAVLSEKG